MSSPTVYAFIEYSPKSENKLISEIYAFPFVPPVILVESSGTTNTIVLFPINVLYPNVEAPLLYICVDLSVALSCDFSLPFSFTVSTLIILPSAFVLYLTSCLFGASPLKRSSHTSNALLLYVSPFTFTLSANGLLTIKLSLWRIFA